MQLTFKIDDCLVNELNQILNELNEKKDRIIEKALGFYFDYLDEKIADKRLKNLENSKETLIDADEVFKELGI